MTLIIISLLLCLIAGMADAIQDKLNFHFEDSIFSDDERFNPFFWNKLYSDNNKWKQGNKMYGEKFFGSSTFLVWTTDAWHLFKFVKHVTLISGITIGALIFSKWYWIILVAIALYSFYRAGFNLFFDKILVRK